MKTTGRLAVVAMVVLGWFTSFGQSVEPEVPGDHFSLEGALELFKKSSSPEEFEKMLNSPDSKVNNLDLNGDGYIDYVRVLDHYEGDVHAFILQAVISERESQDIAVIELEKLSNGKAVLQIIGDEDIYGVTTIIEPTREVRTYAGTRSSATVVNVWAWPSVQYVYHPSYSVWISPWGWHRRPIWYHTWRPVTYVHYYSYWRPYRPYYTICHTRRVVYAHNIYRPHRRISVVVRTRYNDRIDRYRSEHRDDYRNGRRSRDDNRRFADNDRSPNGSNIDRRRDDDNVSRRSSSERENVTSQSRSSIRERSAADASRRGSSELRRAEIPKGSVSPRDNRRDDSSPLLNRTRSSEGSNLQRPTVRERSAPVTRERSAPVTRERNAPVTRERSTPNVQRSQPELRRDASGDRRSGAIQSAPQIRQQAPRPSVERSRPEPRPSIQQRPAQRERSVSVPHNNRSVREASSRPPTVNRGRPSESPSVQHRAPSRSPGATRSAEGRRGR